MRALRRKLWRDIRHARTQFTAITVTVFLGIALYAASYDSFRNLEASYDRTAVDFRFANFFSHGGDAAALAAEAAASEGVEAVETRIVQDIPLRVGEVKMLGRVISLPDGAQPEVNRVLVTEGAYATDGALVESHLAEEFDLVPGSTLEVLAPQGWVEVTVDGVVASPEYIWPARDRQDLLTTPEDFGVIFVPDGRIVALTGLDAPNDVGVYYRDGEPNPALTARLTERAHALGAGLVYDRAEQPSNAALAQDLQGFEEMSLFFPVLFLAAAAMAAYVVINRLVHAQRPQVGLLMAEGYTRRQVQRHYLGYGLVPALVGAIPGAIAGVLLARVVTRWYIEIIAVPVEVVAVRPSTVLIALAVGVVMALVAAWAPARTAARLHPAETMRGETPVGSGRPSVVERLLPPLRRLPIRWRMAIRGVERNPRRTLYTLLGVVLSLVLVLVSWGMLDTTNYFIDRQFQDISREDARVFFAQPVTADVVRSLEEVPGVAAAEPSLEVPAAVTAGGERYDTALVVLDRDTEMHGFFAPGGDEITLPSGGLLAGSFLAEVLDVSEGDEVEVVLPDLGATVSVSLAGLVEEPMGTVVYMSSEAVAAEAGTELPATSALVRYDPGVDRRRVRMALTELPSVAAVTDARALLELVDRFMGLFYGFVGVMLVFGAAMAFALIFNSMSVNIAERRREMATLQAVGMDQGMINRLLTSENMVVAILGIPPGLAAGVWVSSLAMASFDTDLFRFDLHMRPMTLVWSALAMVVVALLSQIPGLRAIGRIDIPRIVKERTS